MGFNSGFKELNSEQSIKRFIAILQAVVDCVRNVMAHAQKPDFVFRRNGRVYLNRRGRQVSTTGSRSVGISGSNAGYVMFQCSVKGTGYPLHSPFSPLTFPSVRHSVPSRFSWTIPTGPSLWQSQFSTQCDLVLLLSISSALSFP